MIGKINHIVVFESLPLNEKQTGNELYNDIIRRKIDYSEHKKKTMTHHYHCIENKIQFVELMKYYNTNSEYMSGGILFHFEMHGNENNGLFLRSNEYISWTELNDLFRDVNISTNNQLFITLATCYGRFLYTGIDWFNKAPFSGYISATDKVTVNTIENVFNDLFDKIIDSQNIISAYLNISENENLFYYKDLATSWEEAFKFTLSKMQSDDKYFNESFLHGLEDYSINDKRKMLEIVSEDLYNKYKSSFFFNLPTN